jgi:hypothetical protein
MIRRMSITMLVLVAMASVAIRIGNVAIACPDESRILEVGEFHGEEVEAQTGETWLGLNISDGHSQLLDYKLTVEAVNDPLVDEPEETTGKKVSVDLPLQPTFLIATEWLSAGPVQTVFEGNYEKTLEHLSPVTLELAGTCFELKVIGPEAAEKCSNDGLPGNAKLVLASGEAEQVLYSLEECGNDPAWFLLWAGDLDRDGKLDLYVSVNQHYNVSEKKLFLSSAAGDGQLVEQVAEFVTSGC